MAVTAQTLLTYLEKSGIKLAVVNGSLVVSSASTRRPNAKEQAEIDAYRAELISLIEARAASTVSGTPEVIVYGVTGAPSRFQRAQDQSIYNIVNTFNGNTGDVQGVSAWNGQTGAVTFNEYVASFNGQTGAVVGVASFAGFTGDVAVGVTNGQVLFHGTTDITGSNDLLWDNATGILSIGQGGYLNGRMQGPNIFLIKASEGISAGDPVYVTGTVGGSARVTVAKANASDPAKMPAAGIAQQSLALNGEGEAVVVGTIDYDTTGLTANDSLYVAAGGGLTPTRPTGAGNLIQNMGRVKRQDSSNGSIIVAGAFRTNDVPNALIVYDYIQMPDGYTTDSLVGSFNGATGGVTLSAGNNITITTGVSGITIDAAGGGGIELVWFLGA